MPIVEKAFNLNDWIVIISIIIFWTIFFLLPKPFPRQITVLVMLYGLILPGVIDNSFGSVPFDFYDIMDGPVYTVMDAVLYLLYPTFAYIFVYFYYLLKNKTLWTVPYTLFWSLLSTLIEFIFIKTHVFTHKNDFNLFYSFNIYLFAQSGLLIFFRSIYSKWRNS